MRKDIGIILILILYLYIVTNIPILAIADVLPPPPNWNDISSIASADIPPKGEPKLPVIGAWFKPKVKDGPGGENPLEAISSTRLIAWNYDYTQVYDNKIGESIIRNLDRSFSTDSYELAKRTSADWTKRQPDEKRNKKPINT